MKKVLSALIYSTRGVMLTKLEQETFHEGDWLTFDKIAKSDMAAQKEKAGKDSYPPYILMHHALPQGHGGRTRVHGTGKWKVQVMVKTDYGCLRKQKWYDPGFFGAIECSLKIFREATRRLAAEKTGWEEMSDKEKDEVLVNVWVGLPDSQEMMTLSAMDPYPSKCRWEARDLPNAEFIYDLPLDKAKLAGALSAIVL